MGKIMKNLQKTHAAVVLDTYHGGNLGVRIAALAIRATNGGIKSTEWKSYMSLFADSQQQLDLLTVEIPPVDKPWLLQSRAYMVSNGVCDAATTTETGNRVNADIDDPNINDQPDPAVALLRPFNIPDVP